MGKRGKTGEHLLGRIGSAANRWQGGRYVTKGYVLVWTGPHPMARKDGYVLEHRLTMAEHIGRMLTRTDIVHHIREDKTQNTIDNLELTDRIKHPTMHVSWDNSPRPCPVCGGLFVPKRKPRFSVAYCSRKCGLSKH